MESPKKESNLKNKKLFEIEESNNSLQKRKLIVEDITYFPAKEYMISEIQVILKYSESIDGFVNILDHEGKEITIEELIDTYYNNDKEYFLTTIN